MENGEIFAFELPFISYLFHFIVVIIFNQWYTGVLFATDTQIYFAVIKIMSGYVEQNNEDFRFIMYYRK